MTGLNSKAQEGFYLGFSGNVGSSIILNQNTYGVQWNLSGMADRNFELGYKTSVGYGGGIKLGYGITGQLGFEFHLGYQDRGMRYEDTDNNDIIHRKHVDVDYLTIAVPFRYTSIFKKNKYKQFQRVRLAIVVGPQIDILTAAKLEYELESEFLEISFTDDQVNYPFPVELVDGFGTYFDQDDYSDITNNDKDYFATAQFGFLFNVGVDIYPNDWLYISPVITSYLGITDMNAKAYRKHDSYASGRNASIGLGISMGFYINQ
ncbi:MAG: PorT family protein [Bacteroidetes bacterium]|nr:PorT family protein [Bacteroidota bacterium]